MIPPTQITPPTEQTTDAAHRVDDAATLAPPQPSVESRPREADMTPPPAAELDWPREVRALLSEVDIRLPFSWTHFASVVRTHLDAGRYYAASRNLRDTLWYLFYGAWCMTEDDDPRRELLSDLTDRALELAGSYLSWARAQELTALVDGGPLEHLRDNREEADR
jgi:hypothetical protein